MRMSILPVCMPVHSLRAGLVLEEVRRGHQIPLEQESWVVLSHHKGSGNWTQVSARATWTLNC